MAQAYRVISFKIRTLLRSVGSKREGDIANTAGLSVLYHTQRNKGSEKLIGAHLKLAILIAFVMELC